MKRKSKLEVVKGTLARLMRAVMLGSREEILKAPSDRERAAAEKVLLLYSQGST